MKTRLETVNKILVAKERLCVPPVMTPFKQKIIYLEDTAGRGSPPFSKRGFAFTHKIWTTVYSVGSLWFNCESFRLLLWLQRVTTMYSNKPTRTQKLSTKILRTEKPFLTPQTKTDKSLVGFEISVYSEHSRMFFYKASLLFTEKSLWTFSSFSFLKCKEEPLAFPGLEQPYHLFTSLHI